VPQLKLQIANGFEKLGWTYEEGKPDPTLVPFTLVTAVRTVPTRKALIGFWIPTDDALLLAWTEMLPATTDNSAASSDEPAADATADDDASDVTKAPVEYSKSATTSTAAGATTFSITGAKNYVNVMKTAMPKLPSFPALSPKGGYVRGYVKDLKGKPLQGAVIGARSTSAGGFYSGASAKTDAKGYYEIQVPWGAAHFYAAGYTVDWGEGRAALGLHPADGEASSLRQPMAWSRTGCCCITASPTATRPASNRITAAIIMAVRSP
jgi:hypothetical protein